MVLLALFADGLQIATALAGALLDPSKWREFFTVSSIAAALVVAVVVISSWRWIGAGRRALGIAFVLANVAFVIFYTQPRFVDDVFSSDAAPPTSTSIPSRAPDTPKPGTTVSSAAPVPTVAQTEPADDPAPATPVVPPPPAEQAWTVSMDSSRESEVEPGSGVQLRFWPYPSGNDVVGDLRYENGYAWAPVGFGSGCTAPYVTYIFSGIPAGTYVVAVHVPDVDGLTTNAEYSGPSMSLTLDQSAHRGQWVALPVVRTSDVDGEAMIGITMKQRYDEYSGDTGCVVRGERIAFATIRVTKTG